MYVCKNPSLNMDFVHICILHFWTVQSFFYLHLGFLYGSLSKKNLNTTSLFFSSLAGGHTDTYPPVVDPRGPRRPGPPSPKVRPYILRCLAPNKLQPSIKSGVHPSRFQVAPPLDQILDPLLYPHIYLLQQKPKNMDSFDKSVSTDHFT